MFKMKLGVIVGFALGWLVGSGRAAKLWDQFQEAATSRAGARPAADRSTDPQGVAPRDARTMSVG